MPMVSEIIDFKNLIPMFLNIHSNCFYGDSIETFPEIPLFMTRFKKKI